jgi:RNA polymerase sigma factor (sigma-70 family)
MACDICDEDHLTVECPRGSFYGGKVRGANEYERAIDSVEISLAHIRGQRDKGYIDHYLDSIAQRINADAATEDWGSNVRQKYLAHPQLRRHLTAAENQATVRGNTIVIGKASGIGHNNGPALEPDPLTNTERDLVLKHRPLVLSLAKRYSPGNGILQDELHSYGLEVLADLVRDYDRNSGVTFGAFAKPFLRGALRDYAKRKPRFTGEPNEKAFALRTGRIAATDSDRRQQWSKADSEIADYHYGRSSLGKSHEQGAVDRKHLNAAVDRYLATGAVVQGRKEPMTLTDQMRAALNQKQWAVFKGRVLDDPPVPISQLARQLGIHEQHVSRILKQAHKRLARTKSG